MLILHLQIQNKKMQLENGKFVLLKQLGTGRLWLIFLPAKCTTNTRFRLVYLLRHTVQVQLKHGLVNKRWKLILI